MLFPDRSDDLAKGGFEHATLDPLRISTRIKLAPSLQFTQSDAHWLACTLYASTASLMRRGTFRLYREIKHV